MLAVITNSLVPCNGRFPAIITIITLFFVGSAGVFGKLISALYLTGVILLGILGTFLATLLLSKTVFKGTPSSFALEMPPYRRPEIAKTLVRSVFDRTLSVLGRAITVAAPAGALIWIISNTIINGTSLLILISNFLDPFGKLLGLDGIIIMAFILGLPANEIVLPIALMAYCNNQNLTEINDLMMIKQILQSNGWTTVTAINTVIFSLFHWPCATALLTVKQETGSKKMMLLAAVLPTLLGIILCLSVNFLSKII
jgi:ferrous iron transport protein B